MSILETIIPNSLYNGVCTTVDTVTLKNKVMQNKTIISIIPIKAMVKKDITILIDGFPLNKNDGMRKTIAIPITLSTP